jgi:Domain of unknown function (DUF4062)
VGEPTTGDGYLFGQFEVFWRIGCIPRRGDVAGSRRSMSDAAMPIVVFLSTVSDEFRAYRDQLVHDLTRQNVAVKVQEDFKDLGGDTLDKLDVYIAHCDAVVHLVGDMCGAAADERQQQALVTNIPTFRANCRRSAKRSRTVPAFPTPNGKHGWPCIMASGS